MFAISYNADNQIVVTDVEHGISYILDLEDWEEGLRECNSPYYDYIARKIEEFLEDDIVNSHEPFSHD